MQTIRTAIQLDCLLCGAAGDVFYEELKDRLFDVPGRWGFRRCSNRECRHVWLDPRPIDADLPLVYETYVARSERHNSPSGSESSRLSLRNVFRGPFRLTYNAFLTLSGVSGDRRKTYGMYLTNRTPGRLLDVGCGFGDRLAYFADNGWQVFGQDINPKAVAHVRATYEFTVHSGPLETLPASAGKFDAVVMNHVVEHVPNPAKLLSLSAQRLAPKGILVAVTPNIESLAHRCFKKSWLHLDPPRHLHLFSPRTMQVIAKGADLNVLKIMTTAANAEEAAFFSIIFERHGNYRRDRRVPFSSVLSSKFFQVIAFFNHMVNRESGEECVLIASRRH